MVLDENDKLCRASWRRLSQSHRVCRTRTNPDSVTSVTTNGLHGSESSRIEWLKACKATSNDLTFKVTVRMS